MTRALRLAGTMAIAVALLVSFAGAQEKISPVSDYQYKRDYAQYEGIKKEADLQERAKSLLAFMDQHPISRMLTYVVSDYLECVRPHLLNKNWAKAVSMEEDLLKRMPTEKTVQAAAVPEPGAGEFLKNILPPAMKSIQTVLLQTYYQANNLPKAAEMGEAMYAAAPDKAMAATLAQIYRAMKNDDKYLQYAEKIMAEFPIEQSYLTALEIAQVYLAKQDTAKAFTYLDKVLAAYGDKVPPGAQEADWNIKRAGILGLMGQDAYQKKEYSKAIDFYARITKLAPQNDEAYYYIGMSKWKAGDPDAAIDQLAKAAVLSKTYAKRAQDYLSQLWTARHPDNPGGIEDVKTKARAELGLK
jgi:tetratricopeptide (TPR) repeat protein